MKQYLFLFVILIGFTAMGQNPNAKSDFWNHVYYGGGIGLSFTNGGFNGSISPSAIYRVNEQFATGLSLNLNYSQFNNDKFFAYGGSILTLINPVPFLQLSGELEQLRINRTISNVGFANIEDNYWSPALFLGMGFVTQNITFGMRYDVLYDNTRSIYANAWMPFVRVYF
ncbi:MAG: alpha-ketoglutarate decarboxylase [Maribacter sp.]|nr:alpha-ketoglutarate decarboxylase [Maribacter sp.]NND78468.1 alpha-ketoglutarate decarboxylase [Maribacter sp.]NNK74531.1 alpha-ketoglutarate decarboxylase [Maribacter sp.]